MLPFEFYTPRDVSWSWLDRPALEHRGGVGHPYGQLLNDHRPFRPVLKTSIRAWHGRG